MDLTLWLIVTAVLVCCRGRKARWQTRRPAQTA